MTTLINTLETINNDIKLLEENTTDLYQKRADIQRKRKEMEEERYFITKHYPELKKDHEARLLQLAKDLIETNNMIKMDKEEMVKLTDRKQVTEQSLADIEQIKSNTLGKQKNLNPMRSIFKFTMVKDDDELAKRLNKTKKRREMEAHARKAHGKH